MIHVRPHLLRALPAALRHRDYGLLWGGQTVSVVGDGVYSVTVALEALRISDHPSALAVVLAARVVPTVLLLVPAGALVDRLPRRLVLLGADTLRGGVIGVVAVLVAAHALDLGALTALSALVGVGDAFFYPAYRAIMPELLPGDQLVQGNALNTSSQTIGTSLLGPALGGVLVAAGGTGTAFAADAGTFFGSAVCLVTITHVPAPARSGRSVVADARQGLHWTVRQRWLWFGILATGLANFAAFAPMAVTVALIVRDALHQGPAAYGATFAAFGAGGLVAAVVAGRLGSPTRRVATIWAAWAVASFALAGVGVAPDVAVVAVCGAITYFGLTYGNLLWARCSAAPRRSTGCSPSACHPSGFSSPGCSPVRSAPAIPFSSAQGSPPSPAWASSSPGSVTPTSALTGQYLSQRTRAAGLRGDNQLHDHGHGRELRRKQPAAVTIRRGTGTFRGHGVGPWSPSGSGSGSGSR